jgi:hypothetical protein
MLNFGVAPVIFAVTTRRTFTAEKTSAIAWAARNAADAKTPHAQEHIVKGLYDLHGYRAVRVVLPFFDREIVARYTYHKQIPPWRPGRKMRRFRVPKVGGTIGRYSPSL